MKMALFLVVVWLGQSVLAKDIVRVSSSYSEGKFDVSVSGDQDGIRAEALKYFTSAGAQKINKLDCPACPYSYYEIPTGPKDAVMFENTKTAGENVPYFLWNFRVDYSSLNQVAGSDSSFSVQFSGPMAEILYLGMGKNLKPSGSTILKNGSKFDMYSGQQIRCAKKDSLAGPVAACSIVLRRSEIQKTAAGACRVSTWGAGGCVLLDAQTCKSMNGTFIGGPCGG